MQDSLAVLRAVETVRISGQWASRPRRTYQTRSQLGSGAGPYVDVIDYRWEAVVSGSSPTVRIALLITATEVHWVKSCPPCQVLDLVVSATAYADYSPDRATLSMSLGGSHLPGVPVPIHGTPPTSLTVPSGTHPACAAIPVTSAVSAELVAIVLPGRFVRVGRNRIWRLREEHAQILPAEVCTLMTRRRAGRVVCGESASKANG